MTPNWFDILDNNKRCYMCVTVTCHYEQPHINPHTFLPPGFRNKSIYLHKGNTFHAANFNKWNIKINYISFIISENYSKIKHWLWSHSQDSLRQVLASSYSWVFLKRLLHFSHLNCNLLFIVCFQQNLRLFSWWYVVSWKFLHRSPTFRIVLL